MPSLDHLTHLDLAFNRLQAVEGLSLACPRLVTLDVRFNLITSVDEILLHPSLETLFATGNYITRIAADSLIRTTVITFELEWRALTDTALMPTIGGGLCSPRRD